MANNEFNKVEAPAIAQLVQLGWTYIQGKQLSPDYACADGVPERTYLRDVVLVKRLEAAIKRINPWISDENLRKVSREVTHPNFAALMEYNHAFYQTMVNYLSVEQDLGKGRKGQTVKLVDFETPSNNEFLCTNQFKVEGTNQSIIPDIVCFVNGIPLAVIECKSPYISAPMSDGINQLRRYANLRHTDDHEGAEKLFWYNQLMVSTCRDQAKVGTISSNSQHYGDWKDAYPFSDAQLAQQSLRDNIVPLRSAITVQIPDDALDESEDNSAEHDEWQQAAEPAASYEVLTEVTAQQRLLAGMFSISNFLDILQNFILFETDDGRLIKKVARYQQYRAVNKVIERLKSGKDRKERSGVVWHTQGSGKSLTMVMLAVKMRRDEELKQYKLVFITDRTQLDEQLSNTFRDAQGETVYNAGSVAELKELLKKDSSDLVTAMVQKFADLEKEQEKQKTVAEGFADLNPSDKIIVLADEAHRTQFGGLAMTINAALPNAPKIGFTGTPLLKTQKMSQAFGGYIDEYKINQAVEDGATVKLLYEGREVKSEVAGDSLDKLFEEYFGEYTEEEQREIKRKYGVEKAVREAPARIRWVCIDLIKHYKEHIRPDGFKAMIVVGSRHAAAIFKKTLDELGAPHSEVIISGDHNDEKYLSLYTDKVHQKKVIANFKKPFGIDKQGTEEKNKKFNNTAFLIVKDMLLTGFDAPIAQVMYIDRKLQDHTLMQAIARVNRTYKGKECGYVVDYHGLATHLTEALELFSSDDIEGSYQSLKDEIPKLKAKHTRAMSFFKQVLKNGKPSDDIDDYVLALKDETVRAQFNMAFKQFAKQLNVILPDAEAAPFIPDMKLLGKIHNASKTKFRDEGLDMSEIGAKVRQLVDEHILSTGVDPKIAPIDLLAANFKESITAIKSDESKASEIESAIKHHITINLDEDPEYYRSLSLRLRDIIEKTAGKWAQQLELMLEMRGDIGSQYQQAAQDVGLSETEFAFYNILIAEVTNVSDGDVIAESTHDEIKAVTQALVVMLDEATEIVDFFNKQDEIKRMKKEIKRAVLDQSFGDKALVTVLQDRFMDLAKTKFGNK
ncbi:MULTISPECIES: type I restriction endonuclease subunit R [Aliivibrio]|uniref:Type I restriction enzyme endonuclease subunit n=1 Tax=Aliivibrio finisterrensis TaxID=511998 RepID=A0A4Q5KS98_9GAMM|nr:MULTISPECIES: type I restriction endonuclease subunit R [Aliivibrio]MDD9178815.1 type I restriction endonuclease subunit R [Aliivibrio sp. A6]RYU50191.1 type I restriction endonuclease subunit R [Aliivibrio finisterrensis]RYU51033.1 type I restriction endonuclease subunit R [Aliivibrio finisterrensis]RYU56913.1 type I restriction endonuclease subunit R [Aliivibrio finisterrensis]RYU62873.1 type I restriction endonuclease subunit R [Aliivibrio finisterrensis]